MSICKIRKFWKNFHNGASQQPYIPQLLWLLNIILTYVPDIYNTAATRNHDLLIPLARTTRYGLNSIKKYWFSYLEQYSTPDSY